MLKIYNTLSRKKEAFKPLKGKNVNIFVCGPTVYDYAHIGHAKTYVQFDVIAKYLRYSSYKVFYLQNITDLDDKIIARAAEQKTNPEELAQKYEKEYYKDMQSLGVDSVTKYAPATEYIKEIISQVSRLLEKSFAYKIEDGIYYDLSKFKGYGKLSRKKAVEAEDAVSRIDEGINKRNKGDFCLWKFSKQNEPSWPAPFGEGRPGWHIEDTAITEKFFGQQYDIHGGARDLIFPHHEAEIAQMEALSGKQLVKYWMHTGFLNVEGKKMSKSLGNFITIRDALKKYNENVVRLFFISTHYRSPINFKTKNLESTKNAYERLKNIISDLKDDGKENKKYLSEFEKAIDDDFEMPKALAVLWEMLRDEKAEGKLNTIKKMDEVFGLKLLEKEKVSVPAEVKKLAEERELARKSKDWKKADKLRNEIKAKGFLINDTENGAEIKKI